MTKKIPRKIFRLLEHTEGFGMINTIKVTYMEMETEIYEMLNVTGLWQEWFICKWKIILKLLMIQPRPSLPPPTPSHTRSTYQHLLRYLVGFIQENKFFFIQRII